MDLAGTTALDELRRIIQRLDLKSTVFRAKHSSNVVPIEGRLPQEKERLLAGLDLLLASNELDRDSPGPPPLWLQAPWTVSCERPALHAARS